MTSNAETYNQVIARFSEFATGHYLVNAFSHGQLDRADLDKFTEYPLIHAVPTGAVIGERVLEYNFDVWFMELAKVTEDKDAYIKHALSDTLQIAEDFIASIQHGAMFGDRVETNVTGGIQAVPFIEEFHHVLSGWQVTITIRVPKYLNACDVPGVFDFITGSTASGGSTGGLLSFGKVAVSGQTTVEAEINNDTLTLVAGTNVTITTNPAGDSVTINATGGVSDGDKGDITVSSGGTVWNIDAGAVGTDELANAAVTNSKIADNAVDTDQIGNGAVNNEKLNDMAQATIKGRQAGAGTGDPEDLTSDQVSTILDLATDPFVRTSDLPAVPATTDDLTQGATNLYNQTHTAEVTGATALTLDKTAISNRSEVQIQPNDILLYGDTSDSNNLKKDDVESLLCLKDREIVIIAKQLGGSVKAVPPECSPMNITSTATMADESARFIPVYISRDQTITGVGWFQTVQGVYTGNNYNGVALYKYDGAGNIDLVASSTNDTEIWKGAANTWQAKAFTNPYSALKGMYYIVLLYSNSAQTTAPVIAANPNFGNSGQSSWDFTNSAKLYSFRNATTSLAAQYAMSGLTSTAARVFAYLY